MKKKEQASFHLLMMLVEEAQRQRMTWVAQATYVKKALRELRRVP